MTSDQEYDEQWGRHDVDEYILCAAFHVKTPKKYNSQPINIESGLVILGRRHHNAGEILNLIFPEKSNLDIIDGFITSKNRFLDRKEALKLAKTTDQLVDLGLYENAEILISEDLY